MSWRSGALFVGLALSIVACSSDRPAQDPASSQSTDATTTVAPDGPTVAPVVPKDVPASSAGPTSSVVGASSTVAPSAGFGLGRLGFGDIGFGTAPDVVIEAVYGALGPAVDDSSVAFPEMIGESFLSSLTGQAFDAPFGRRVCWTGVCAFFGGTEPEPLAFVGWSVVATPLVTMTTDAGITIGSRWSDHLGAMTVSPGGCPARGSGATTDGIDLVVQGGEFATVDESGEYVELLPDPTLVTVVGLSAGSQITAIEEPC